MALGQGPARTEALDVLLWGHNHRLQAQGELEAQRDARYIAVAICFTSLVIFLQMRSGRLAVFGIIEILLSMPLAYFVYLIVLAIPYNGTANMLAIFLTLGIGADDLFLFTDSYRLYGRGHAAEEQMELALRRATPAMACSSFTTMVSFISLAFSPSMPAEDSNLNAQTSA